MGNPVLLISLWKKLASFSGMTLNTSKLFVASVWYVMCAHFCLKYIKRSNSWQWDDLVGANAHFQRDYYKWQKASCEILVKSVYCLPHKLNILLDGWEGLRMRLAYYIPSKALYLQSKSAFENSLPHCALKIFYIFHSSLCGTEWPLHFKFVSYSIY